jgi:hypothetical protein
MPEQWRHATAGGVAGAMASDRPGSGQSEEGERMQKNQFNGAEQSVLYVRVPAAVLERLKRLADHPVGGGDPESLACLVNRVLVQYLNWVRGSNGSEALQAQGLADAAGEPAGQNAADDGATASRATTDAVSADGVRESLVTELTHLECS